MFNITPKSVVRIVTISGASILAVNSVIALTRASSPKSVIMPLISLAVSLSAFAYATQSSPVLVSGK